MSRYTRHHYLATGSVIGRAVAMLEPGPISADTMAMIDAMVTNYVKLFRGDNPRFREEQFIDHCWECVEQAVNSQQ
jgi:hypothetical protein